MKFGALKGMVDSIISGFSCPDCKSGVEENDIEIIGTAGTSINVEVICPECQKSAIVKGQVFDLDLSSLGIDLTKLKEQKVINKNGIKDEEIKEFNKTLKTEISSISDLFGEEEKG